MEAPACKARFKGKDIDVEFVNPGDEIKDVEEDVRASWRSCGLVVDS